MISRLWNKLRSYGRLVMFSHTIFSLSFGVVAFLTASSGKPKFSTMVWAGLALLGARTGANALNRGIDWKIDAANPRTAHRQLPQGEITLRETLLLTGACFVLLVFAAWRLGPLCLALSPLALVLMTIYSYTKRFTWLCHLILGITCACAPVGAWLAVTGRFSLPPLLLGGANCLWTAGFDILYGCQDYEFDLANGLHSIPVRFGVRGALLISTLLHLVALGFLGIYAWLYGGQILWIGVFVIGGLMAIQHHLVSPDHLEHVELASYSVSQVTSLTLLLFGILDLYV